MESSPAPKPLVENSHDGAPRKALQQTISIASATDERYAMPLSVTILSALDHLAEGVSIDLYLLDGGLSAETKNRLLDSWRGKPIDVHWIKPDHELVADLMTSHHISPVAYYRILLPEVLPNELSRVLYLDCDLLIRDDLQWLWEQPFEGNWCRAIQDVACPYVDAREGMDNFRKAAPYLASLKPVANYEAFQIKSKAPYFNSGVLLIDLESWRRESLPEKMLALLREHRQHIWCWDQYALNVQLSGHWEPLPLRWNMGTHAFEYPSHQHAPIDMKEFAEAIDNPAIVHYTTEFKPWNFGESHPYRDAFFQTLDRTAWKGWRPEKPPFRLRKWFDRRGATVQKHVVINYRKLTCW